MDTIGRIRELMSSHGWSEYRLAREAGLSQSTVANIFHRGTLPSIPTLESICNAFGISLSQFFDTAEAPGMPPAPASEWNSLTPSQQELVLALMRELRAK